MRVQDILKIIECAARHGVCSIEIGELRVNFAQTRKAPRNELKPKGATAQPQSEDDDLKLEHLLYEDFEEFERQAIRSAASV